MDALKILVVDDEEAIRDLTCHWVKQAGHHIVAEATNGIEAV